MLKINLLNLICGLQTCRTRLMCHTCPPLYAQPSLGQALCSRLHSICLSSFNKYLHPWITQEPSSMSFLILQFCSAASGLIGSLNHEFWYTQHMKFPQSGWWSLIYNLINVPVGGLLPHLHCFRDDSFYEGPLTFLDWIGLPVRKVVFITS